MKVGEVANKGGWQGWVMQGLVGIWVLFSAQWTLILGRGHEMVFLHLKRSP